MQIHHSFIRAISTAVLVSASTIAAAQEPMQPSGVAQALMPNDVKTFFENAASSNMFEIESSKMAAEKATDPELKEFAMMMIEDHEKAGQELKALAEQKGVALPTKLARRHQAMLDDLKDETGKDFDEEYKTKMVVSHKEAVSLFDQTAKKSKDPEVKAFAAKTLPTLQKHGGKAKQLPDGDEQGADHRNH